MIESYLNDINAKELSMLQHHVKKHIIELFSMMNTSSKKLERVFGKLQLESFLYGIRCCDKISQRHLISFQNEIDRVWDEENRRDFREYGE